MQQLRKGLENDKNLCGYGISAYKRKSTGKHIVKITLRLMPDKTVKDQSIKYLLNKVPILSKYQEYIIVNIYPTKELPILL